MTTQITRTTAFRFTAFQYDDTDFAAFQEYVTGQTIGSREFQYTADEISGVITPLVPVGEHPENGTTFAPVSPGDYIVKIFSKWWTVIPVAAFDSDWATI